MPTPIEAAIEFVHDYGAVTFMQLADHLSGLPIHGDEVMTVGRHAVGDGATMTAMSNPPNVVLWNGAAAEFLAVIEQMLAQEPRVVLERTSVERYMHGGMQLLADYTDDGREEILLPAVDFGDEIAAEGYDGPTWLPVLFTWAGAE